MPNTASAKKAVRKNEKRRTLNRAQRSTLRTFLKKFRTAVSENADDETVTSLFRQVQKKIDQAAAKHLIHKNTAARLKSRLVAFRRRKSAGTGATAGA